MSLRGSRRHQHSAATLHQELDSLTRLDNKADRDDHPMQTTPSSPSSTRTFPADNKSTPSPLVTQPRFSPPPAPSQQQDTHINNTNPSFSSHTPSSSSLIDGSLLSAGSSGSGSGAGAGSILSTPPPPYPPSFVSGGSNSLDELSHASWQYFSTFSTSPEKVSFFFFWAASLFLVFGLTLFSFTLVSARVREWVSCFFWMDKTLQDTWFLLGEERKGDHLLCWQSE